MKNKFAIKYSNNTLIGGNSINFNTCNDFEKNNKKIKETDVNDKDFNNKVRLTDPSDINNPNTSLANKDSEKQESN